MTPVPSVVRDKHWSMFSMCVEQPEMEEGSTPDMMPSFRRLWLLYHPSLSHLPTSLLGSYNFPHHIVPTVLRPDIVLWDDVHRTITLIELTICFETSYDNAAERKAVKYQDIVERAREKGYRGHLVTLQVGSRGLIDIESFNRLQPHFNIPKRPF